MYKRETSCCKSYCDIKMKVQYITPVSVLCSAIFYRVYYSTFFKDIRNEQKLINILQSEVIYTCLYSIFSHHIRFFVQFLIFRRIYFPFIIQYIGRIPIYMSN